MDAYEIRQEIRNGRHKNTTSGLANDNVQANLVVLPKAYAFDFLLYALRNQTPIPIIEVLEDGKYISRFAKDSDIRTDIPFYNIYKNGTLVDTVEDVTDIWQDDFVSFLIGCSFTFEDALMKGDISLKHIEQHKNVAMYKTNIPTERAGIFHGNMVVSMRPIKKNLVDKAIEITSQFKNMHGGPVHVGDPRAIGIEDITKPDYGDSIDIADDEVPVFWGCGVTPQNAILQAKPSIMISHKPGHMFITDINNEAFKEE
ncbi:MULTISPECIES: putative hydro-lyase [unclassified Nosocomiicoccus]|uniref:putative hydro-lyase n=1 Tax=unclassified Nosocomiicoccus TaxID=2646683 RepID=UPI0008A41D0F|nr:MULTISPECIES: putative hydro-lyase [unclassified Nosocomiicoccus]OFL49518.1 hypothetical protein HMPREF2767_05875 [Nosocomiicoccus sp. HMSC067E10]OFO50533.1 hypothetical protein HMPREF3029_02475 [Nosocomiicoccus sp. HMSC059G07]